MLIQEFHQVLKEILDPEELFESASDSEDVLAENNTENNDASSLTLIVEATSHASNDSNEEPKNIKEAHEDASWMEAMQEELQQFRKQEVWELVDLPNGMYPIGYTQEEGIDYDDVFALVAIIEGIRIFLAYAASKNFIVYEMDIKSAFLYRKLHEEVCVSQPLGFEDPKFPYMVFKLDKALYGFHQAPRARRKRSVASSNI
ncbi:hypothetical protein E3N88_38718 [Mikania micrantha]|uniref:Reverse transcriptase Ty1/copia-type domain-containing protein n=1 Tax=Mikania micrantha TaxID=192012 RepID=A0A5N6LUU9_9ASTR|nr:hypothetical protein E3N88_38718 [Mikania micrantha]